MSKLMRIIYSLSLARAKPLSHSTTLIYELQYLPLSFPGGALQRRAEVVKGSRWLHSGVSVVLVRTYMFKSFQRARARL